MVFCGNILEYPIAVGPPQVCHHEVFFTGGRRVLALNPGTGTVRLIAPVETLELSIQGRFACGGLWLPGKRFSRFFDVFGKGLYYADQPPGLGRGAFCGHRVVYFDRPQKSFVIKELDSEEAIVIDQTADSLTKWAADDEHIYAFKRGEYVKCFDWRGNLVWTHQTSLWGFGPGIEPALHRDLVIVQLGVVRETRADYQVAAFNKNDGSEIWRTTLPLAPQNVFHAGGRICMALEWQMIVLDETTGDMIVDAPSGLQTEAEFTARSASANVTQTGLYTMGGQLFFVSLRHRLILVFSGDGKTLLQKLPMPDSISPLPGRWIPLFQTGDASDDSIFLSVDLNYGVGGLLVLQQCNGQSDGIEITPRPHTEIVAMEDDPRGCHGYRISVTDADFGQLVRYGEIAAREVLLYHAADNTEHDHFDPYFNGQVTLELCGAGAPSVAAEEIAEMKAAVTRQCQALHSHGFDDGRKSAISFNVVVAA